MSRMKLGSAEYEAARERKRAYMREYMKRKAARLSPKTTDQIERASEAARAIVRAPNPEGGPLLPLPVPPVPGSPVSDTLLQKIDASLQDVETMIRRTRFEIAVYMEYRRTR